MNNLTQAEIQKCYKAGALTAERAMELLGATAPQVARKASSAPTVRRTRRMVKATHARTAWSTPELEKLVDLRHKGRTHKYIGKVLGRSAEACVQALGGMRKQGSKPKEPRLL